MWMPFTALQMVWMLCILFYSSNETVRVIIQMDTEELISIQATINANRPHIVLRARARDSHQNRTNKMRRKKTHTRISKCSFRPAAATESHQTMNVSECVCVCVVRVCYAEPSISFTQAYIMLLCTVWANVRIYSRDASTWDTRDDRKRRKRCEK